MTSSGMSPRKDGPIVILSQGGLITMADKKVGSTQLFVFPLPHGVGSFPPIFNGTVASTVTTLHCTLKDCATVPTGQVRGLSRQSGSVEGIQERPVKQVTRTSSNGDLETSAWKI
eukprot:scaffold662_cov364-Pavlova_lutheri.AAC.31